MARIEILVEEPSMKEFLSILLPRIVEDYWHLNENYFIRSFEGKSDLQKNIPSKIRVFSNWHEPIAVAILQDQDNNDCKELKKRLVDLCMQNGSCERLVRIVCKELESWYIGDLKAIHYAYGSFKYQNYVSKAKYREPDRCNASHEMRQIVPGFQKIDGAKRIAPHIDIDNNKSQSFKQTITGLNRLFAKLKPNNE